LSRKKVYYGFNEIIFSGSMRTFDWKSYKDKGKKKDEIREEKMLEQNLEDLKEEALKPGGEKDIREIAKEILTEED